MALYALKPTLWEPASLTSCCNRVTAFPTRKQLDASSKFWQTEYSLNRRFSQTTWKTALLTSANCFRWVQSKKEEGQGNTSERYWLPQKAGEENPEENSQKQH